MFSVIFYIFIYYFQRNIDLYEEKEEGFFFDTKIHYFKLITKEDRVQELLTLLWLN